jgi:hypothetical protein
MYELVGRYVGSVRRYVDGCLSSKGSSLSPSAPQPSAVMARCSAGKIR